ncbi:substrate-binding domain-containing protein [Terrimonas pollutisoli]|uniref:substrate-binding domain-containing protein n=1 Tax=Terrimonas pollutisoli TaxID=3034147 RepID=UPI0023EACE5C|nr:substrate-binding domain-containing protein [Terrimonas sp. H1YJ31]
MLVRLFAYCCEVKSGIIKKPWVFFALCLSILLCSCSGHKQEKKYRIGFSQCTFGDAWRQTMQKEVERELSFHPEIELIVKDANLSAVKQIAQIQELIDEKVDLLIAIPAEAEPIAPIIEKAYAKGIPVILVDRSTLAKNYTAFIGANNYKIGSDAGAYAIALLKAKGNVLEIAGPDKGSSADIGRHTGFTDVIKKYPGIKAFPRFSADWDKYPVEWEKQFTEKLQSLPNIDLIFAQNDRLGFAAYKVCKKLGLDQQIKIIGIDGLPGENGGIDLVEKGILKATILYPTGGEEAIQTAFNILEKKPYQKETELSTTVIDSTNVRIMRLQNEKLLAQQDDIDERQKKIEEQIAITENQTNIILAISTTLALALIFGGILYYYLQENKKINKKLALQKEEIADQRNQLIELMAKVKEATDAKFNFFTNISHELRTPLTLIMGPLEDTLSSPKLHFTIRNNLDFIQRNSIRLLRLINQLMDFRKIEEGKMKLHTTENNISEFVLEIANSFRGIAQKKSISYKISSKVQDLNVWFDVTMLDKVLFNLLSNAFKFTAENGTITVTIDKLTAENMAVIKVEDTGIGMDTTHAFELFYQGQTSFRGSGLGLSLSKELIDLHHGYITVQSEKNKGTAFEIKLPIGKAHLHPDEILAEKASLIHTYEDVKIYTTDMEPVELQEETNGTYEKDRSILIIEDNDDLRAFLKKRIGESYEIHEADNGEKGITAAFDIVPDLIISDILLPGQDGLQITETLKQDIRTSHIPIILLTAKGSISEQIAGIKSQADAFIVKPFNLEYLEETIKNLLKNRAVLREHYTSELPTESKTNSANKIDRKFINEFTALVENNLSNEDFAVDDICKKIGISRVQLYRKVKALIGYNVNDYILNVRLQKAKFLLAKENLTISEVAFRVGFSSQGYFSTVFKSKFGVTPSEFKDKKKEAL